MQHDSYLRLNKQHFRTFSSHFSFDGDNASLTWEKSLVDSASIIRLEPTVEIPNESEIGFQPELAEVCF